MNKIKAENQAMCKEVRREMARHTVDCSEVQVTTSHGTVTLNGRVKPLRGHEETFEMSSTNFLRALRQRKGIRDVVVDWTSIL